MRYRYKHAWFPALATASGVGLFVLVISTSVERHNLLENIQAAERTLLDLEQRLAAMFNGEAELRFNEALLWRSYERADAEIALQDKVIETARSHSLSLESFRTETLQAGRRHDRIGVVIEGSSELAQLYAFLAELGADPPNTAVSAATIRRTSLGDQEANDVVVSFRLQIWGFWEALL